MAQRAFFYGWFLVPILFVLYGFGITPAYGGWGIFAPRIEEQLQLSRTEFGGAFGLFTFLYSAVGPVVGLAQDRFGIRAIMTVGFVMSAAGFWWTGHANSTWEFFVAFGVLGGAGVGLCTIIPIQTLAQHWFLKYRARVIGIIFSAGGVVGFIFPRIDRYMLEHYDWREGWFVIAGVSFVLAIAAWVLVRDTPEQLGQLPDGGRPAPDASSNQTTSVMARVWTAQQALRTPQFLLLVLAGIAYAVPWGVVSAHGPLFFSDLGFTTAIFTSVMGLMSFVSIFGRLSGGLGDWISPRLVLSVALVIESAGVAVIMMGTTPDMAKIGVSMMGLGFGAAYISVPVVFSEFFGRKAFATTSGVRIFITGIFNSAGPLLAGVAHDRLGSYTIPFIVLIVLGLIGAAAAAMARHPGEPPEILEQPLGARIAP